MHLRFFHVSNADVSRLLGLNPIFRFQVCTTNIANYLQLPGVQITLMLLHKIPLLPDIKIQMIYASEVPMKSSFIIACSESCIALFTERISCFKPILEDHRSFMTIGLIPFYYLLLLVLITKAF